MSRTVIVTPFGDPQQLAAACVLSDIPGDVVPIGDFSAIVQDRTGVADGNSAAAAISKLAGRHEVLLLVRSEEQIDAAHYRHGERESDVPAGLALSNLPAQLEQLLLESLQPSDVEGWIDTSKMSKLQASAATMTPARAALARTAIMWFIVALLAVVAVVIGVIAGARGAIPGWIVVGVAGAVLGASLYRIYSLLGRQKA